MKAVSFLVGLVALAVYSALSVRQNFMLKAVDPKFIKNQKKVLALFEDAYEQGYNAEYYKVGKDYDIEAAIKNYSNENAVNEFLLLYRTGTLPKNHEFSIFYQRMRDEAIALFQVMFYANDFDTFYKTAAWAKVYMNQEQFLYAYYIAVVQRADLEGMVVPAPYEVYPQFFFNKENLIRMYRTKMQGGLFNTELAAQNGIVKENDYYVYYANYSNSLTYPNEEQKLSYFTEDIGLNSFYFYFHSYMPFWWQSGKLSVLKDRRGEFILWHYQQLLARYSLERLANGLGEIPEFSWYSNFKTGYYPQLTGNYLPFAQRSNDYDIHTEDNYKNIRFLDTYEKNFLHFQPEKAMNYVGNYWHMNEDLYRYETIARHVLGASPKPFYKYSFMPTVLDFYQTSLRDPAFYQLYQRIVDYLIAYKEYVKPYSHDDLHFVGVKINDLKISELATYFEYFDVNVTSSALLSEEELVSYPTTGFVVRQPRMNYKPFTVSVDVKSDTATDAVFKIFLRPQYHPNGMPVSIEEEWMKLYELDWFVQKLVPGENKIERKSSEFVFFKDDSIPINEVYQWLDQGKVPYYMSVVPGNLPRRLMLPKGTTGGYPFQMIVFVYPYNSSKKGEDVFESYILDNKPFGYPFDRPLREVYFRQPNIYFQDVEINHKDVEA